MTSSVTNLYTPTSTSGQVPAKNSAVFGAPQPSGDFLAMLMGAFGQITPTPVAKMGDNLITETFLTPVATGPDEGIVLTDPVIDAGIEGGLNTEGITEENLIPTDAKFGLNLTQKATDERAGVLKDFHTQDPVAPVLSSGALSNVPQDSLLGGVQNNLNITGVLAINLEKVQNTSAESVPVVTAVENNADLPLGGPAQLKAFLSEGGTVPSGKMNKDMNSLKQAVPIKAENQIFFQTDNNGYSANFLAANDTYKPVLIEEKSAQGDLKSSTILMSDQSIDILAGLDINLDLDIQNAKGNEASPSIASSSQAGGRGEVGVTSAAHTTTQAVILHLQSIAQNRDTRSFTLHLDPPELGKMQVKMSYGRDKSVRADIMVEKSDTLRLMEQDSNNLKSALENTGLQIDPGSLNFSLADQGAFERSDSDVFMTRSNNQNGNDVGQSDDIAGFEFKSSEEWSVDPSTGITRYNIVV